MEAYKVLMVEPGRFTTDELKNNYRTLAARLHPGVCTLSPEQADTVMKRLTRCYRQLLNESPGVIAPVTSQSLPTPLDVSGSDPRMKDMAKKMDMEKFNRIFEDSKIPEGHERGHGTWLQGEDAPDDCDENGNLLCDMNTGFAPDPYSSMSSRDLGFFDLSEGKDNNLKCPGLQFTDVRDAHSARHNMMNSRMYTEFKERPRTLEELKSERGAPEATTMSQEDKDVIKQKEHEKALRDAELQSFIEQKDTLISKQFDRSRASLFGER